MRIVITPAKQRFGLTRKRRQWKWVIVAGNGQRIDPRDTYANPGDIVDVFRRLVASDEPVTVDIAGNPNAAVLR